MSPTPGHRGAGDAALVDQPSPRRGAWLGLNLCTGSSKFCTKSKGKAGQPTLPPSAGSAPGPAAQSPASTEAVEGGERRAVETGAADGAALVAGRVALWKLFIYVVLYAWCNVASR